MDQALQLKGKRLPCWAKKKTQLFAAYKRYTLNIKTQVESKRMEKDIIC